MFGHRRIWLRIAVAIVLIVSTYMAGLAAAHAVAQHQARAVPCHQTWQETADTHGADIATHHASPNNSKVPTEVDQSRQAQYHLSCCLIHCLAVSLPDVVVIRTNPPAVPNAAPVKRQSGLNPVPLDRPPI